MKQLFSNIFLLFIFSFCLPSNNFMFIPIKTILFILLLIVLSLYAVKNNLFINKQIIYLGIVFICLLLWAGLGINNGYSSSAIQQLTGFISLFGSFFVMLVGLSNKLISIEKTKNALYISAFSLLIFKLFIEFALVFHAVNMDWVFNFYSTYLRTTIIYMPMNFLDMVRINVPNDYLVLCIIGFYLIDSEKSIFKKIVTLLLCSIFVLIVYSRLFIIQFLMMILVLIIIKAIKKMTRLKVSLLLLLLPLLFFFIPFSFNMYNPDSDIAQTINYRFNSVNTTASDDARDLQTDALINDFKNHLWIGSGIGAFDSMVIRSDTAKFSYEREYLSFLMQLGVIGFSIIIVGSIVLFFSATKIGNVKNIGVKVLIIFNFLFWMIKPIFNPGFLSSTSASVIIALIVFAYDEFQLDKSIDVPVKKNSLFRKIVW